MANRGGFHGWQEWIEAMKDSTVDIVNGAAEDFKNACQDKCPVRTGTLRDGYNVIKASRPGEAARVVNDVEYHNYVDQGTENMAGHHMTDHARQVLAATNIAKYIKE